MAKRCTEEPLIILCPPRSFSSVVCAMLGQHPAIYGFPELNLFVTDTLDALVTLNEGEGPHAHTGVGSYIGGLLRVIAELYFGEQTALTVAKALDWVLARRQFSTKHTMDSLLVEIFPRIGVDKSTRTAMSRKSIQRASSFYPSAKFLHLTRHPVATVKSMWECHQPFSFPDESGSNDRTIYTYCAHVWYQAHRSILDLTNALPSHQKLQVQAEDLLQQPDTCLANIASWLGGDAGPDAIEAMKHPERSPYATCGLLEVRGDNDATFLRHPKLRKIEPPPSLKILVEWGLDDGLVAQIRKLANQLGYG